MKIQYQATHIISIVLILFWSCSREVIPDYTDETFVRVLYEVEGAPTDILELPNGNLLVVGIGETSSDTTYLVVALTDQFGYLINSTRIYAGTQDLAQWSVHEVGSDRYLISNRVSVELFLINESLELIQNCTYMETGGLNWKTSEPYVYDGSIYISAAAENSNSNFIFKIPNNDICENTRIEIKDNELVPGYSYIGSWFVTRVEKDSMWLVALLAGSIQTPGFQLAAAKVNFNSATIYSTAVLSTQTFADDPIPEEGQWEFSWSEDELYIQTRPNLRFTDFRFGTTQDYYDLYKIDRNLKLLWFERIQEQNQVYVGSSIPQSSGGIILSGFLRVSSDLTLPYIVFAQKSGDLSKRVVLDKFPVYSILGSSTCRNGTILFCGPSTYMGPGDKGTRIRFAIARTDQNGKI